MAIPSYTERMIVPANTSFLQWVERTNDVMDDLGTVVLSIGSDNVGNTDLLGVFSATTIAGSTMRGGTSSTSDLLTFTSNTTFNGQKTIFQQDNDVELEGNFSATGSNKDFQIDNRNISLEASNTITISANSLAFGGSAVFSETVEMVNVLITGNATIENIVFTGNTILEDLEISGNVSVGSTLDTQLINAIGGEFTNIQVSNETFLNKLTVSGNATLANTSVTNLTVSANTSTSNLTVSANTSTTNLVVSANTSTTNLVVSANTSTTNLVVSGNTALANTSVTNLTSTGTSATKLSVGTTAQRPTPQSGMIRFNTSTTTFEGYDGASWSGIGSATISNDTSTNQSRFLAFVESTSGIATNLTVSSTKLFFNPSTGTLNATEFNALSDEIFKENIEPITSALDIIDQVEGVLFDWKETSKQSAGVIAQQLETILPRAISETEGIKSVNYGVIIAYLIEAVKELRKINNK
jgi:hypothetical protein